MDVAAIVTAAGSGTRMGTARPKQFLLLGGRPMLVWSLQALENSPIVRAVLPVVPVDRLPQAREILGRPRWGLTKCLPPVAGGRLRQDSVRLGFQHLPPADVVLIHDGARPFIDPAMVEACAMAAAEHGAAVCAVSPPETVKETADGVFVSRTLDRRWIRLAQTPQAFRRDILATAYGVLREGDEFTDEAAMVEAAGFPVRLVDGSPENIKITAPQDMVFGRALASSRVRAGRH